MGVTVTLLAQSVSVRPGGDAAIQVRVRNTGSVVDRFSAEVLGGAARWATVDPEVLPLFPGAEGFITVSFRLPQQAGVRAGPMPFALRVSSKQDPSDRAVEEATLLVDQFDEASLELQPHSSQARLFASHNVVIENRGNGPMRIVVGGADPDQLLAFRAKPRASVVPPGARTYCRIRVRPRKLLFIGQAKARPFKVFVQPEARPTMTAEGVMTQKALIPKKVIPVVLALVAIVAVLLLLPKPAPTATLKYLVPCPVGSPAAEATPKLTEEGFKPTTTPSPSRSEAGTLLACSPTDTPSPGVVSLTVAIPAPTALIRVPSLKCLSEAKAKETLLSAGLTPKFQAYETNPLCNALEVVEQDPPANSMATPGSTVTYNLATPTPATPPAGPSGASPSTPESPST